jgi:hypothetical protein
VRREAQFDDYCTILYKAEQLTLMKNAKLRRVVAGVFSKSSKSL